MEISFENHSNKDIQNIKKRLGKIQLPDNLSESLKSKDSELLVSVPHKSYVAYVSDLAAGKKTEAFKYTGLRYILNDRKQIYGSIHLFKTKRGKISTHIDFGNLPSAIDKALFKLEKDQNHDGKFRFFFLTIHGIHVKALWLNEKKKNLFMPVGVTPALLKRYEIYKENDFFKIIKKLAKNQLKKVIHH